MMRCQREASVSASSGIGISEMSAPAQKERPRPAQRVAGLRSLQGEPGQDPVAGQAGGGRTGHDRSRFAMISRMISEVPEAMVQSRTSRKKRSTANSRM